ncbi:MULTISPECIES: dihydrodipicolinate synthase family protein [unclassified Oscillibacter]|uniref:dihydrodipicolinate synthase family protein n=1 Tax=unclassified Oscillibacter TaxID=2629304 RepID=UPI0025D98348|nr:MULTISPECIES: dihydrodipicolinate synthase family protein [unclassified Oscillibacter]
MAFSIASGVWPVMITPYHDDKTIDYKAIARLCDWYVEKGCAGVFAVCQSSEMLYLTPQEKLDIAKATVDAVGGRIQIVVSGHTADDKPSQFRELEDMMRIPGIGAYVLVSNRLDQDHEGEAAFESNAREIFDRYPEIDFGIYECPAPWKRLVSTEFLRKAGKEGRMVFLKDTCCDYELVRERLKAVEGTSLKIFNANAQSWYDSVLHGAQGYCGVMANFHPELYKWVYDHKDSDPERAQMAAHFLTMAGMIEMRIYPCNCKYHQKLEDVPMSVYSRSADMAKLDKNARGEVESLIAMEKYVRRQLGI